MQRDFELEASLSYIEEPCSPALTPPMNKIDSRAGDSLPVFVICFLNNKARNLFMLQAFVC